MQYPSDFTEEDRTRGICGVLAIAVATGVTMEKAHEVCARNLMPHQKRHSRRTYDEQIANSCRELGKRVITYIMPKMNINRWHCDAPEGVTCLVFVSGHVMIYRDGYLMDQQAHCDVIDHPARRRFVTKIMEIYE